MGRSTGASKLFAPSRRIRRWQHLDTLVSAVGWLYFLVLLLLLLWAVTSTGITTWAWLAVTGWIVGPVVGLLLLAPPIRARRGSLKLLLRAAVAGSLAYAGLSYASDPQFASMLFVSLAGPAWALWLVHRVDEREAVDEAQRQLALIQRQHLEVMRALRASPHRTRRVAGSRRKV
jgi:hypothetical protein